MLKGIVCLMAALSIVSVLGIKASAEEGKPRVAVINFDNKAGWGGWGLGNQAADMLTTKLVKTKRLSVYEREKLDAILKEQHLGEAGMVTPESAAKVGKLLGVQYMIIGAVTEFGESQAGGHGLGIGVQKNTFKGTVDVRVVNVNTGEIMSSDTGSSKASFAKVDVFGIGGGKDYDEKKASEVLRGAIDEVGDKIVTELTSGK